MDLRRAVARVCHYFSGEFKNGDIPGPLFFMLLREVDLIRTEQRVERTQGTWIAIGLSFGSESAKQIADADREEIVNG